MTRYAYGARHERGGIATYTIAYERNEDTLDYSLVRCSPKDRFEKKIGREKAELRLQEGFSNLLSIDEVQDMIEDDSCDFYDFTHSQLTDIIFADIINRESKQGKKVNADFISLFERQAYLNELAEYA